MQVTAFLVVFFVVAISSFGAPATNPTSGSWKEFPDQEQLLKKSVRETAEGNVLSFKETSPTEGVEPGVRMKLEAGNRIIDVHLGPRWFVIDRALNIAQGERISIVGLKIQLEKKPVLVAQEIRQGNKSITLREQDGALKRDNTNELPKDRQMEALAVMSRRCAGCHQAEGHPGARFLSKEGLDDKQTVRKLIQVIEKGKMPPEHANFKKSVDGKLILDWLKSEPH